jgi:rhodanese-related sulfurtransferase
MTPHQLFEPKAIDTTRTPEQLAEIVSLLAARPDAWMARVRLRSDRRWYERLHCGPDYDVWLIAWLPGQATGFHDHGRSNGAFAVGLGVLEEHRPGVAPVVIPAGQTHAFGTSYAHDVRNTSNAPTISIHAYSPPLTEMTHYELDGDDLVPLAATDVEHVGDREDSTEPARRARGIDDVLAAARARLQRLSPCEAYAAVVAAGALLVDIRPSAQREVEGMVPGSLVIERNVLEWRFDPASDARLSQIDGYDARPIVLCSEGYTSSLAAAALQDLGLWRATDVIGGFRAWRAVGLPTVFSAVEDRLAVPR